MVTAILMMMTVANDNDNDNDDDDEDLARLLVLASLPARRGVFGVEALVRPTPCISVVVFLYFVFVLLFVFVLSDWDEAFEF